MSHQNGSMYFSMKQRSLHFWRRSKTITKLSEQLSRPVIKYEIGRNENCDILLQGSKDRLQIKLS